MPEIISRSKAKARGLKRYFTGEACKHGHICERYVKFRSCFECNMNKNKNSTNKYYSPRGYLKYYEKHRHKVKEHQKKARLALIALKQLGLDYVMEK